MVMLGRDSENFVGKKHISPLQDLLEPKPWRASASQTVIINVDCKKSTFRALIESKDDHAYHLTHPSNGKVGNSRLEMSVSTARK